MRKNFLIIDIYHGGTDTVFQTKIKDWSFWKPYGNLVKNNWYLLLLAIVLLLLTENQIYCTYRSILVRYSFA